VSNLQEYQQRIPRTQRGAVAHAFTLQFDAILRTRSILKALSTRLICQLGSIWSPLNGIDGTVDISQSKTEVCRIWKRRADGTDRRNRMGYHDSTKLFG
jgi:hypothetical protein